MSKALIGLLALGGLGALAFYGSKAAAHDAGPTDAGFLVTGPSGTTYSIRQISSQATPDGRHQITVSVSDASGEILQYTQFQGDDSTRILVPTAPGVHVPGDLMWLNAVSDFGIFASGVSA